MNKILLYSILLNNISMESGADFDSVTVFRGRLREFQGPTSLGFNILGSDSVGAAFSGGRLIHTVFSNKSLYWYLIYIVLYRNSQWNQFKNFVWIFFATILIPFLSLSTFCHIPCCESKITFFQLGILQLQYNSTSNTLSTLTGIKHVDGQTQDGS